MKREKGHQAAEGSPSMEGPVSLFFRKQGYLWRLQTDSHNEIRGIGTRM